MKSHLRSHRAERRRLNAGQATPVPSANRRGTVLIVVIGLLGLLALVGFTFYTFANQEKSNAEYFAASEKDYADPEIDPEPLFEFGIRQVIMGGDTGEPNSALYGGRWSLMGNLFGGDMHPHSGKGMNLVYDRTSGTMYFDQDHNGTGDSNFLLGINDGPAARSVQGDPAQENPNLNVVPAPDVDYTAADHNGLFLTHRGYGLDPDGRPVFVVKPAFHPVQMLRTQSGYQPLDDVTTTNPGTDADTGAFSDNATANRVLRPHKKHLAVSNRGNALVRRFISPGENFAGLGVNGPFPFPIASQGVWNMSVWTSSTPYQVGDWVFPPTHTGYYYRCVQGGSSSTSNPFATGPFNNSTPINDGSSVQWVEYHQPYYEFDTDPDGDDINEAIVLDLGHPVQELPNGTPYVPLFSFSIYDGEGLVNLAATGNLDRDQVNSLLSSSTYNNFLSKSHQGHSTFEINPQFVLNAGWEGAGDFPAGGDANSLFTQHNSMLKLGTGQEIDGNTDWRYISNAELLMLLSGRAQYNGGNISAIYEGRYGEKDLFESAVRDTSPTAFTNLPKAGRTGIDDDGNLNLGEQINIISRADTPPYNNVNYTSTPWQHPMDFLGVGDNYNATTRRLDTITAGPSTWIRYNGFSSQQNEVGWEAGLDGQIGTADDNVTVNNTLLTNLQAGALGDDAGELATDPVFAPFQAGATDDNNFAPGDGAPLRMSKLDLDAIGLKSRLQSLAPYNLRDSVRAEQIRDRLTTASYDLTLSTMDLNPIQRSWEVVNDGNFDRFPPLWTGAGADPFRTALRQTLQMQGGQRIPSWSRAGGGNGLPKLRGQRRLFLNHVAKWDQQTSSVWFRELVEHPSDPIANQQQEREARTDRQQMARDIYVLLYVFGWGENGNATRNPLVTPNNAREDDAMTAQDESRQLLGGLYTFRQCEEMAQFAINYVNALDSDHVIDHFEFDVNLANGWNLDDDPATDDPSTDRYLVAGVEEQTLTVSEALLVATDRVEDETTMIAEDHPATEYDDTEEREFAYVELRNASPNEVRFGDAMNWRIILQRGNDSAPPTDKAFRVLYPKPSGTNVKQVDSGDLFTIMTAGDAENLDSSAQPRPSFFRVDPNWEDDPAYTLNLERIIPQGNSGGRLDLITENQGFFEIRDGTNSGAATLNDRGDFFDETLTDDPTAPFLIRLQRRSNLNYDRPNTLESDGNEGSTTNPWNPWVTVDELTNLQIRRFQLKKGEDSQGTPPATTIATRLEELFSRYRRFPLERSSEANYAAVRAPIPGNATTQARNTLRHLNETGNSDVYQLHFNRPLLSRAELFSVPLYGPDDVTSESTWHGFGDDFGEGLAGPTKFLRPLHPDNDNTNPTTWAGNYAAHKNNAWYRLLNFVEVPSTTYPSAVIPQNRGDVIPYRLAGKINLNTIRHPEVWASLIADEASHHPDLLNTFNPSTARFIPLLPQPNDQTFYFRDRYEPNDRDWWQQFIASRDGQDPVTQLYLPGMPHSRPFRDFNYVGRNLQALENDQSALEDSGLEHTLLRSLPLDVDGSNAFNPRGQADSLASRRRLTETRTSNDMQISPSARVDVHTRNRILSKLMRLTTIRSQTFYVFVQVEFYEAAEIDHGGGETSVRIGQKLERPAGGHYTYRRLYVVDRSRAYELLGGTDLKAPGEPARFTINSSFDWKQLVPHHQTIE